jgi:hypothetical protein
MSKKLTYEFVKEQFEKEGYELLSKEYINAHTKLKYRCPKGHEHSILWNGWQQGYRCPYCAGQGKPTIEFIISEFAKENYKLLTKEYKNCEQKLEYICPNGHKHSISWDKWNQGRRCRYCSKYKKEYSIDCVKTSFEKEGYRLLSKEYLGAHAKLKYICPKGHKHSINWHSWQQGHRCPYCINIISKGEIQIRNFIESLGTKVSSNDRKQIFNPFTNYPLELDVFMPTLNKAVEYNGEHWHKNKDVKNRDLLKQQLCKSKNIKLLTIWDKEWFNENERCKNKIIKFVFNNKRGV